MKEFGTFATSSISFAMDVESEFSCCNIDYTNNTVMNQLNSDDNYLYAEIRWDRNKVFKNMPIF